MEAEALRGLRNIVRHKIELGQNEDAGLSSGVKVIVERYDRAMNQGYIGPGVIPFRSD